MLASAQADPFGLRMAGENTLVASPGNEYLYNGKELQDELGLGWYDYGFRFYDPEKARFVSVDPLAEKFAYLTTYQYASNDPIRNIDLDGLEGFDPVKKETQATTNVPYRNPGIMIDPGHGDNHAQNNQIDPGALSPTGELHEKDLALGVSVGIESRLSEVGLQTSKTRTEDINVDPQKRLQWRIDMAEGSTMFVSVHLNASSNENASGFAVYHNGGESEKLAHSISAAQSIMNVTGDGTADGSNLYVIKNFKNGPSVLIETGFITNEQDRNTIQNSGPAIGREIGNGIIIYLQQQGIVTIKD
ncbi:MAG: N-acetylmuramoyl-L-alanine amidase [Bacteroidia bacterium]